MIVFYFQHRGHGGVPSLIINLICTLHALNHRVKLFNYANDVIDSGLKKRSIDNYELIDLDKTSPAEYGNFINSDDVLLVTNFYVSLKYFFKVNPLLLFYNVYPDALVKSGFHRRIISSKKRNRKLLLELQQNHSVVFMDDTGVRSIESILGLTIADPRFLPVSVEVPVDNMFLKKGGHTQTDVLRVSYVGRSVGWKNNSIKKILDDILDLKSNHCIIVNIVVDDKKNLEEFIGIADLTDKGMQINIFENISQAAIGRFLLDHSDLHFGMGTTALEGAKMGIPTIRIDFSHQAFPENYMYRWLYETENYNLGNDVEVSYFRNDGHYGMADIMKISLDGAQQALFSKRSYDYVLANHRVEKNINQLIAMAEQASFRLKRLKRYIPHYFGWYGQLKRIYSIFAHSK